MSRSLGQTLKLRMPTSLQCNLLRLRHETSSQNKRHQRFIELDLPDLYALGGVEPQRILLGDTESLIIGVDIANDLVAAELVW